METALSLWGYDIGGADRDAALHQRVHRRRGHPDLVLAQDLGALAEKQRETTSRSKTTNWPSFWIRGARYARRSSRWSAASRPSRLSLPLFSRSTTTGITFRQKKADLFAKSVKELLAANGGTDSRAEALYILSYVARSDRSYERAVYDALSSYVTDNSEAACKNASGKDFHGDRTIQLAMRIIGERRPEDEETGRRLKLEGGCFVGLDLYDERGVINGFAKARLSGSMMFHADFEGVDLPGAELQGIIAGDYLNYGWSAEKSADIFTKVSSATQEKARPTKTRNDN